MAHGVVPLVASSQKARLQENLAALDISLDAVAMCDLGPLT
jgi:diketogulonate reductase-like aldo/keto reductase